MSSRQVADPFGVWCLMSSRSGGGAPRRAGNLPPGLGRAFSLPRLCAARVDGWRTLVVGVLGFKTRRMLVRWRLGLGFGASCPDLARRPSRAMARGYTAR